MNLFSRLFKSQKNVLNQQFNAALAPNEPFFVVGDIHGCDALLSHLLTKIRDETTHQTPTIVFVGDYVDRGEESAKVLRRLFDMCRETENQIICLAGNHEEMLLQFLDNPTKYGARWLRFGGLQTMASFGIRGVSSGTTGSDLETACVALREEMGENLIAWLKGLPLFWQNGNVAVVHAGADPALPISEQDSHNLKWGHKAFLQRSRNDGVWVIHGHTIVKKANSENGRIALDTGAYATGRLTAAHISSDGLLRFLEA